MTDEHTEGLSELVSGLLGRTDQIGAAIAGRIRAEVRDYDELAVPAHDLRETCRAEVRNVLRALAGEAPLDRAVGLGTGRRRAEQNVPEATVLAGYRVGVRYVWELLVAEAARTGLADSDTLVRVASSIWALQDGILESTISGYRDATTERLLAAEQERSALVEALLTGMSLDADALRTAADVLRMPRHGPFVVVAAEVPEVGRQALPRAGATLRRAGIHSAWQLRPDTQIGIVHLRTPAQFGDLVGVLADEAVRRAGVSPSYDDLHRTGPSLRFAEIAMLSGRTGSRAVTVFDDSPVEVATAAATDVTQRLARTVFASLDALPGPERDVLLDTLEAWLACGGSTEETAKRLYVHPNTVRLRLRRISEHTGRSLSEPRGVTELTLALYARRQGPDTPGEG